MYDLTDRRNAFTRRLSAIQPERGLKIAPRLPPRLTLALTSPPVPPTFSPSHPPATHLGP